jgi:hypothetical protein
MTEISKQLFTRSGLVAAVGILIGTVCQASLRDPSQDRPAPDADFSVAASDSVGRSSASDAATRNSLSDWRSGGVSQARASSDSRPERARVVELEVEIGAARPASN